MDEHSACPQLPFVQPAVLVGGRSTRFGGDKLQAPWAGSEGGEWLVDQPRLALARATGAPVWAAGDCHPAVGARFSRHLPDVLPGAGPISGIVATLRAAGGPVLILSGDLPAITAETLLRILAAARANPEAEAMLANASGGAGPAIEPCIGLYRPAILPRLQQALAPGKTLGLHRLLACATVATLPIEASLLRNANRPSELR